MILRAVSGESTGASSGAFLGQSWISAVLHASLMRFFEGRPYLHIVYVQILA